MNALDIRKKRKDAGLTQKELAKILGVSGNTIINWERGEVIPKSKHAILYNFLNSNIGDFENIKKDLKLQTEVKQVPFEDFMEAEYLPAKAQAGYLNSLEENNHLDLETILVPKEFEKGNPEVTGSTPVLATKSEPTPNKGSDFFKNSFEMCSYIKRQYKRQCNYKLNEIFTF